MSEPTLAHLMRLLGFDGARAVQVENGTANKKRVTDGIKLGNLAHEIGTRFTAVQNIAAVMLAVVPPRARVAGR